ncbi:hypothetical protein SAMN02799630_06015 [Paenibacillus sp. UNCCL117]|nr:hypothetical protein SAMN04488602_13825 [Paenibacillus sp. cl123]SFW70491.1 hypothetical protein SAMN02799630_06015 [Paenibacillus sp. UNCCL117]
MGFKVTCNHMPPRTRPAPASIQFKLNPKRLPLRPVFNRVNLPKIIGAHDGKIMVDSEVGQGTTMKIILPTV